METIEPTTTVVTATGVSAVLVVLMCVDLPLFGSVNEPAKMNASGASGGWNLLGKFLSGFTWTARLLVLSVMWATWELGRQYIDTALAVPPLDRTAALNASVETMQFVKFQSAWLLSTYTAIFFFKMTSDYYTRVKMMPSLKEILGLIVSGTKVDDESVAASEDGSNNTLLAQTQAVIGLPFFNQRIGLAIPVWQSLVFALYLVPFATVICYEFALFRDQTIPGWDTVTTVYPDPWYRIFFTTMTVAAMVSVVIYIFFQLMSIGMGCMGREDYDPGLNVANVFNLANVDYRKLAVNPLQAFFSWRGTHFSEDVPVDGVEHSHVFSMNRGSVMLAAIPIYANFLHAVIFSYNAFLLLKNNERWLGFLIQTVFLTICFTRVANEGNNVFTEVYVLCYTAFLLGFIAPYGWNYNLNVAGWDPEDGLMCPSGQERFCFYSIPSYRNELSYTDMSPVLMGLGFLSVALVVIQLLQLAFYFSKDGVYKPGLTISDKLHNAGQSLRLSRAEKTAGKAE